MNALGLQTGRFHQLLGRSTRRGGLPVGRSDRTDLAAQVAAHGYGYQQIFIEGDGPVIMHRLMLAAVERLETPDVFQSSATGLAVILACPSVSRDRLGSPKNVISGESLKQRGRYWGVPVSSQRSLPRPVSFSASISAVAATASSEKVTVTSSPR